MNDLDDKARVRLIKKYVNAFIKKQYPHLKNKDKNIKVKELMFGFQGIRVVNDKTFVTLRLPEGVKAIVSINGSFRDEDFF
ncbi:MAG: hypothetical protein PHG13_02645 [Candidatus Pacebacteria bacterium]|nr:hypothetical protein [Candidatus Paceibacterota bacterium]MDD5721703.1 hypothetical protein [Candidatus Paceibacterota bacterium]